MAFGVDIAAQRVSTFVVAKRVSLSQKFDFFSESCPRHSQIQKESDKMVYNTCSNHQKQ